MKRKYHEYKDKEYWESLANALILVADIQRSLRSILIERFIQTSTNLSEFAATVKVAESINFDHRVLRSFTKDQASITYKDHLEKLKNLFRNSYPIMVKKIDLVIEKLPLVGKYGRIMLCTDQTIKLWVKLIRILSLSKRRSQREKLVAKFKNHSKQINLIMKLRPKLTDLRNFEMLPKEAIQEINQIVRDVNWEKVITEKLVIVDPKLKHEKFIEIADKCLGVYKTKVALINACKKNGITIGLSTFNQAYNYGHISKSGIKFMEQAPKKLLDIQPSPVTDSSTKAEGSSDDPVKLDTINLMESILVGQSEALLKTLELILALPLKQRVQVVKNNGELLYKLAMHLTAVEAKDPNSVIDRAISSIIESGTPVSAKQKSKNKRVRRGSR